MLNARACTSGLLLHVALVLEQVNLYSVNTVYGWDENAWSGTMDDFFLKKQKQKRFLPTMVEI